MNAVTKIETGALALPEEEMLQVLQSSLYPGAAAASVKMVLSYCRAAGLDPMQKPVHIVPMWDNKARQMRDVVMPGVNLYRTQAARSGQFAGMTEPEFGPDHTDNIGGQTITYPEWCRVTVKRMLANGTVAEFTAREFWLENYATKGGQEKSIAPNAMWTKRPRGQIAKCAAAQALRIAFPEIASQPTADEMEGKALHIDADATSQAATEKRESVSDWIAKARATTTDEAAAAVWAEGGKAIAATKNRADYAALRDAVIEHRTALKTKADAERTVDVDAAFVADIEAAEGEGNA
jgi:phage recombination protein Bet